MSKPNKINCPSGIIHIESLKKPPKAWSQASTGRSSAVLFLILEGSEYPQVVLTKRSTKVKTHKGQISFPGGHREAEDSDPIATALRESWEELQVPAEMVEVLGALDPIRAMNGNPVIPIVAKSSLNPQILENCEDEVEELILAPLPLFIRGRERKIQLNMFGKSRETIAYFHGPHVIWGLTAQMIYNSQLEQRD